LQWNSNAITAEQDDLTRAATAIGADFGSSIFTVAQHFIALEQREVAATKEAETARVVAKKKAIASKKKDRESRKRKAAAAQRALTHPHSVEPVDPFSLLSPEERRLEVLRRELLSEGNEGIAVPASGMRRRRATVAAAASSTAGASEPDRDRFSTDTESSSEYETDSESEDEPGVNTKH
jgi:hypothetical protein